MRRARAASRPRRAASLLARWRTRRCDGLTINRWRLTSTLGSPGAGSTTAVRSSTAVTQTRLPSTSASKSGRISSSSSMGKASSRTSSVGLVDGRSAVFRFDVIFISQLPDNGQYQTRQRAGGAGAEIESKRGLTSANTRGTTSGIPKTAERLSRRAPRSGRDLQERFSRRPIELRAKTALEVARVIVRRRLQLDLPADEGLDRRRPLVDMAAGDDAVEIAEVCREVQGEAMAHHRPVELDADRGHLLACRPHAGESRLARLGLDAQLAEVIDQRALQRLLVFRDGQVEPRHVEHRVAHQLAWAVIGRLAAPVGPDDFDVTTSSLDLVPQQVLRRGGLAHGEHVRVLEEQQGLRPDAVAHGADELGLEVPGLPVGDPTQPAGSYVPQGLVHRRGTRSGPARRTRRGRSPSQGRAPSSARTPPAGNSAPPRRASSTA